ncbi:MAG: relaxase/mobilization nuclease domain-containing protein, partial [Desulfarculales bacterium]|nr:relaxase/mobilization nuclease domain-containing protein [Desulfarculales bacterium]
MVSKHISCDPHYDNYRKLARYIADNEHGKVAALWCVGCSDNEDYETSISEVMATQALNTRTKKEKTYHVIISFRPEDKEKLTLASIKEIESRFAEALGLREHQRHCALHVNTDNPHIHIACNLIHPEKLSRNEPYRAYNKMAELRRELEKKYGLAVDNDRDKKKSRGISEKAAAMEAFSGRQSFESYCQGHKEQIMQQVSLAQDWQSMHKSLAVYGIAVKPHGNGLILQAQGRKKNNIKASALDRNLSRGKLESRFGIFQESRHELPKDQEHYEAEPFENVAELEQYRQLKIKQQNALAEIKAPFLEKLAVNKKKWKQKRLGWQMLPLTKKDRASLIRNSCELERQERKEIYADMRATNRATREQGGSLTWPQYCKKTLSKITNLSSSGLQRPNTASQDEKSN